MDKFEIICNWMNEDDKDIHNLIVCSTEEKGLDRIMAENCVCLIPKNTENSFPKLELEIKSKFPFKELNIYSEASLIEVFGAYSEYLCTCKAEFIDDWEGLAVYHANIKLPGITNCTVKFTRTREEDRMWLYSIQPTTIKTDLSNHRLFNFQNIFNLLSSKPQIIEKAGEIKKLMEIQPKTSNGISVFRSLADMTNKGYNFEFQDFRETLTKCLNNPDILNSSKNSKKDDISKSQIESEYIIDYIDKKFVEMKAELMNQMEVSLAQLRSENSAKLDEIIKLMENAKM